MFMTITPYTPVFQIDKIEVEPWISLKIEIRTILIHSWIVPLFCL